MDECHEEGNGEDELSDDGSLGGEKVLKYGDVEEVAARIKNGFLVLVLVLITSTSTFPASAVQYCGPDLATDPKFPGYVETALSQVIEKSVAGNAKSAGITFPPDAEVSASAVAYCALVTSECRKCLDDLLPYVRRCSSFTTGAAHYGYKCRLFFERGQYCGSKEATDPDFNVYAAMALNEVLDDLATRNKTEAKLSYPSGGGAGSAYAEASCSVTISNEECHKCLYNGLLPYVRKCTSFTTGAAHYDTCSLYFQINE
ncbi:hypothetical protein LINPERPRIM_LOCUS8090 [Linum perenne]